MRHLSDTAVTEIADASIEAVLRTDADALVELTDPLFHPGQSCDEDCHGEDQWQYTVDLLARIVRELPTPAPGAVASFGVTSVDADGNVDPGQLFAGLTPQIEAEHPDVVAYMRMLTAQINGDPEMSMAVWRVAFDGGFTHQLMWQALHGAARIRLAEQRAAGN